MAPLFCPLMSRKIFTTARERPYLEDLDVLDSLLRSSFDVDLRPLVDDSTDLNK